MEQSSGRLNPNNVLGRLVGSIVEKGISENEPPNKPLPPRPSLLSFPVARHRSHGPHWAPVGSIIAQPKDNDEEEEEEEERFMNADSVAAFAKPLQRKEKKDMDLRRWKDMLSRDDPASTHGPQQSRRVKIIETRPLSVASADAAATSSNTLLAQKPARASYQRDIVSDKAPFLKTLGTKERLPLNASPPLAVSSSPSNGLGTRQASSSLESDIDVENHARLQTMSPEEIAEAQAELLDKMDPALLSILKKRGEEKLKKRKHSVQGVSITHETANNSRTDGHFVTPEVMAIPEEKSVRQKSAISQGFVWDTWTERVEAARDLRFSFDGNVVEDDVLVSSAETGGKWSGVESAAERDFLRTEGDPGAAGYTIKEAIALARSVIPGQRSLALHLLASVLDKALNKLCQSRIGYTREGKDKATDWEAIWAYALGPEPELVLALRMALDDNHASVVLACVKVIQCLLSCSLNENFFDILENMGPHGKDIFTASVFRSKPEIDLGFLRGCYWKYSAKPSNIVPFREEIMDDGTEDTDTIQKDVFVAGQDVAAGLVRMDILPRIYHLLETEPTAALEDSIISITIAIARHSPKCTTAILKYPKFVQTIVKSFKLNKRMDVLPSQINSVRLLKVLARYDQSTCMEFVKNGTFNAVTWHLFQFTSSLDSWVKLGKQNCKLSSTLMVEQLRLWKVCIHSGCCVSRFPELFPALCLWLSCPSFEKLREKNLISEFTSVSKEAYLVLEAFAETLPNMYSQNTPRNESGTWDWSYVSPMIDSALSWITLAPQLLEWEKGIESVSVSTTSLLWLYSGVMRTISKVLEKISAEGEEEPLPWLPEFVPKIGLAIIKHKLLNFSVADVSRLGKDSSRCSSFMEFLCFLRERSQDDELALASVSCLHGLTRTIMSIQNLIESARSKMITPHEESISTRDESVLAKGILTESLADLTSVSSSFRDSVSSEWAIVQSIELHKRGGLAPGVGLGWGASGGGFWSTRVLLAQADAGLLSLFLNISLMDSQNDQGSVGLMDKMNSALAMCLIAGPRDYLLVERAFEYVLSPHALEHLACCIKSNKKNISFEWECSEGVCHRMSSILASHFRYRWLQPKGKSKAEKGVSGVRKGTVGLETIHEDGEMPNCSTQDKKSDSSTIEWAHQRMPLPPHWFLSAISAVHSGKTSTGPPPESTELLEVAKAGVFFLAGLESSSGLGSLPSPVVSVPLVWKFHALSTVLLVGMDIIEDKNTRNLYSFLQELYGQILDEARLNHRDIELLRFKSEIHENYSTFLEMVVEQYAAVSYGDVVYGRQVSIYLHQCVEHSVRLSAWTVLSNARVLELLPSLDKCLGEADGYLEPVEENEAVIEAYLKSWTCGALDRAATRGSVAYTLVVHHFSSLVLCNQAKDKVSLRNKIVKTLVRDLSRKRHREGMMVDLLRYSKGSENAMEEEKRMEVWKECCEGNSTLLSELEKLKLAALCGRR
ncbi:RNA polymerase II-associated protein 1 N-terminal [Arabidopsis thaliana x Arabidopsis arenosa]|uniref:RNA polymerase II-associated protein 1 N-terminal n=1 Tax=Arabidopsis thaliana x Arabidopsis arenosa TaxID=1240361 RepID=A0A8T1XZZ3_9BRAS|nr:RNA polymerase II-associated protein 1 N-terminal [Arabidopsis thaliana x Arabidopsis arenosa]